MLCGHIAVVACDVADVGKAVARIFFSEEEVGLPLSFPSLMSSVCRYITNIW